MDSIFRIEWPVVTLHDEAPLYFYITRCVAAVEDPPSRADILVDDITELFLDAVELF